MNTALSPKNNSKPFLKQIIDMTAKTNTDGALPLREVAMIAAIIGAHDFENAYNANRNGGSVDTYDKIGQWAVEFYHKHKETDWEDFSEDCTKYGYTGINDWDEAIQQFTALKIKELSK